MLSILFWVAVGIVLGWFVLPQPQWAAGAWNWVTSTVKGWFS